MPCRVTTLRLPCVLTQRSVLHTDCHHLHPQPGHPLAAHLRDDDGQDLNHQPQPGAPPQGGVPQPAAVVLRRVQWVHAGAAVRAAVHRRLLGLRTVRAGAAEPARHERGGGSSTAQPVQQHVPAAHADAAVPRLSRRVRRHLRSVRLHHRGRPGVAGPGLPHRVLRPHLVALLRRRHRVAAACARGRAAVLHRAAAPLPRAGHGGADRGQRVAARGGGAHVAARHAAAGGECADAVLRHDRRRALGHAARGAAARRGRRRGGGHPRRPDAQGGRRRAGRGGGEGAAGACAAVAAAQLRSRHRPPRPHRRGGAPSDSAGAPGPGRGEPGGAAGAAAVLVPPLGRAQHRLHRLVRRPGPARQRAAAGRAHAQRAAPHRPALARGAGAAEAGVRRVRLPVRHLHDALLVLVRAIRALTLRACAACMCVRAGAPC